MYKHILIIPSWYPTKRNTLSGSFFREQGQALVRHQHQVGVIYPQFRPLRMMKKLFLGQYGLEIEDDAGLITLRWHDVLWIPRNKPYLRFSWFRNGMKLFEAYRDRYGLPDVIHVHSMLPAGLLAKRIKDKYGIPFVITEHSSRIFNRRIDQQEESWIPDILQNADAKIAVSQAFSQQLQNYFGGDWIVIPNMVWHKFLESPLLTEPSKQELFTFINVASMDKNNRKGHRELIDAFAQEFKNEEDIQLFLVGNGVEYDDIQAHINNQHLSQRIQLLGPLPRDAVIEYIANSDAFVLASHYEPFGVVVIESLALGKPVVATRSGGPDGIITEDNGILVPIKSPKELGRAMRQIKDTIADYDPHEIREDCARRYSEESIVKQLETIYGEVIE